MNTEVILEQHSPKVNLILDCHTGNGADELGRSDGDEKFNAAGDNFLTKVAIAANPVHVV